MIDCLLYKFCCGDQCPLREVGKQWTKYIGHEPNISGAKYNMQEHRRLD